MDVPVKEKTKKEKKSAVIGVQIYNRGQRIFIVKGSDLLEGGERQLDINGVETGLIRPEKIVTVTKEKAISLVKGYKGEVMLWGDSKASTK